MNHWLFIPLLIFISGYFGFPSIIAFAKKVKYLDEGEGRKRHKDSIAPIGGWLIYTAFALTFLLIFPYNLANLFVFFGFTGIFILGVVDDKFPMNATKKFLGQFIVAALLVYGGEVHIAEYMSVYGIPPIIGKLICMTTIVFVVNAYNLVDGINGLAAMLGMVAIGYLGLWLFSAGLHTHFVLSLSFIAALLVFLRYNLFKTEVFLGDNGSMIIGLLAVYFSFVFIKTYTGFSSIVLTKCNAEVGIALVALAIPIADTLRLFILRPYYLSKSPFKADRNHVHHLLIRLGLSHIEASLMLFGLSILLVMASLAAQDLGSLAVIFIAFFISAAFLMSLDFFVYSKFRRKLDKKTVFNSLQNMNQSLNKPQFLEYVFVISIFLLAMSIPFHRVSTSIPTLIVVGSFLTLFLRNIIVYEKKYWSVFNGKFKEFLKHPYSLIILSFFSFLILHVSFVSAGNNLQKTTLYLLLIVYWICVFQLERIIEIKSRNILTAFILGCAGFGVFIILQSFVAFPESGWGGFFYKGLLTHVKANPVTHSLYYNLAILFLGNNFKHLKEEKWRIVYWLFLIFFVFMVVLYSSKVGLVVLFFALIFALFNMINNKRIARITVVSLTVAVLILCAQFGVFTTSYFFQVMDSRLIVWGQCIEIIKDNFMFGTGLGTSVTNLTTAFEAIGFQKGVTLQYNAQNQFLDTFMETGIIGLIFLLVIFSYNLTTAFIERNRLYFAYICIIVFYMMTESLFQTQMGMVSFAFFNALFLATFRKEH